MSWKSPTDNFDESNIWSDEPKAYDNNLNTFAYSSIPSGGWGEFLDFLISPPVLCDKVRLWAYDMSEGAIYIDQIQVDVYYADTWHTIYIGGFNPQVSEWHEYSIPDSPQVVSKARVKFHNRDSSSQSILLYEFNFNQVAIPVRPLVGGFLADSGLIGKGLV